MESLEEDSLEEEKSEQFLGSNLKHRPSISYRVNKEDNVIKFDKEYVYFYIPMVNSLTLIFSFHL